MIALLLALALQQAEAPKPPLADVSGRDGIRQPNGTVTPVTTALRIVTSPPSIDGRLDDAVWALAPRITRFTQQQPNEGAAPTESTEVRIAYDAEAIYVAARMYDSEPARIAAQLGRRDNLGQSDAFEVDFDSYHDHQTSFQFYVNPLGIKNDMAATGDFSHGDQGWDPVWDVATTRDSLGWTAEMRIPLSQLRFNNAPTQTWGVNFYRYIQRRSELSMWSFFGRTAAGYASNFGHIAGLEDLPQPRRLELLPYLAANEERLATGSRGNPFNDGSRETGRVGLDAQYGITSNLTLNATVNPDFGQVEADPAQVNLTAYETFFQERRPFFVEGAGIFRAMSPGVIPVNGPQYLYSRRIGRAPQAGPAWRGPDAYTDVPSNTTILGAAKLSGRTAGGWQVGLLEASTAREYATVDSSGFRSRDQVEPFTNYAVVRARNDFGSGATTFGITATAVNRDLNTPRLAFLRSAAYTGGLDFGRRFSSNRYSMFAAMGWSYVTGDTLAIQATQLSSARYYQRPDAGHVAYDPTRTSLAGWFGALGFGKDQGMLRIGAGVDAYSPGFEINDLGWQSRVDRVNARTQFNLSFTRPGRVFRTAHVNLQPSASWNFDGDRTGTWVYAGFNGELLNYWSVGWGAEVDARSISDNLLRGGPAGISPRGVTSDISFGTDYRKPLRFNFNVLGSTNELGYRELYTSSQATYRPSANVSLSLRPSLAVSRVPQMYVTAAPDSTATATFGTRYVLGLIRQRSLDLTTRMDWTMSPTLSVQLYTQPFIATGQFMDFRELRRPRSTDYIIYGRTAGSTDSLITDGDGNVVAHVLDPDGAGPRASLTVPSRDFTFRSLRGNAVLRWEYRPGSTLFLVWTQSCSLYGPNPAFDAGRDMRNLCQGRSDNVFAVKLNYWMSM